MQWESDTRRGIVIGPTPCIVLIYLGGLTGSVGQCQMSLNFSL